MTGEQYEVILSTLADKLLEKENEIMLQRWHIADLENKLSEIENKKENECEKVFNSSN